MATAFNHSPFDDQPSSSLQTSPQPHHAIIVEPQDRLIISNENVLQLSNYLGVDVTSLFLVTNQQLYNSSSISRSNGRPNNISSQYPSNSRGLHSGNTSTVLDDTLNDDNLSESVSFSLSHADDVFYLDPLLALPQTNDVDPQLLVSEYIPNLDAFSMRMDHNHADNENILNSKPQPFEEQGLDALVAASRYAIDTLHKLDTLVQTDPPPRKEGKNDALQPLLFEIVSPNFIMNPTHSPRAIHLTMKRPQLTVNLHQDSSDNEGMTPRIQHNPLRLEDDKIAKENLDKRKGHIERVIVRAQNSAQWGTYKVDRFGRIIADPHDSTPSPTATLAETEPHNAPGDSRNDAPTTSRNHTSTFPRTNSAISSHNPSQGQSTNRSHSTGPLNTLPAQHNTAQDPKIMARNAERETKWVTMLGDWAHVKPTVLKRRVRKGIPNSMRGVVWPLLMDLAAAKATHPPRYYFDLLSASVDEQHEIQIRKDLPRLMQDNIMFKSPEEGSRTIICTGQAMVYNILKAYTIHDPEVGYVQGMDSVVAPALLYFPEETAFWFLEQLLCSPKYNLRQVYLDGFPLARQYAYVHKHLLKKFLPNLGKSMDMQGIQHNGYCFRWYTMRYAQFAPELSYRILDIYLHEGDKILYRIALALLQLYEKRLLADTDSLLENLMKIETDFELHAKLDGDFVIEHAMKISLTTAHVDKLVKEYHMLLSKNPDDPSLL